MNNYFTTGKTIVIDDQYNDAKPLLDALCKKHIPFIYTQGKPNSDFPLPNTNAEDAKYYNLIFLDLNLDFKFASGSIGTDSEEKIFKSTHANIINTIIKNENRSFIVVIWSNEEENYLHHYESIFAENSIYTTKRPYKIISLSKPDYFTLNEGGYAFKKDKFGSTKEFEDKLFSEIDNKLEDLEAFKLFCEWDRVVSMSVSDTVDDIMSMIHPKLAEKDCEDYLANLITSISVAYSGYDGFLSFNNDQQKTDSFFLALTQILNDDIDRNILEERQNEFKKWKADNIAEIKKLNSEISKSLLNKKLLIYNPKRKDLTGSVYKSSHSQIKLINILFDCFDKSEISKELIKRYKKKYKIKNLDRENQDNLEMKFCKKHVFSKFIPIEINISPLCDIVQNKLFFHRTLIGYLIPSEFINKSKKDLAYLVKSTSFIYDEREYFLATDLRTFSSCNLEDIESKDYLFTLRTNLVNDIQTKLASHVSRLGVLFV